jgi:RNA polymerase sigma factor (sigma-70 family)
MTDELRLLREYAENASEEAFAAVLSRHIRMVYAAAMRHTGNPHEAEEITQAVFIILARKAGQLPRGTVLSGWLFQTTRLTACSYIRNAARRRNREREATMQSNLEKGENDDVWRQVAPLLDSAVASLRAKDRDAVVMRYVEGRPLEEVGLAMGASESAAQRRIHRALERLRKFFAKRGVMLTGAILAGSIAANAAPAVPAGLTASVATVAALKGATVGASTVALIEGTLKALAWAKLKLAAGIGAGVALATGTVIVAVTYVAEAAHAPNKVPTLSQQSPFVRYLSDPPWIKKLQFAHGQFSGPGFLNTNDPPPPTAWLVMTNTFGVQPSGSYFMSFSSKPGVRSVSGVNDQNYWTAQERAKWLGITPVAPDATFGVPSIETSRPRMEELRHLGLPGLRPGTFAMHEDGTFTATTLKDELLEGRILKVSNDRPLALTYHVTSDSPNQIRQVVSGTLTYRYASATAPLPENIGLSDQAWASQQLLNGRESTTGAGGSLLPSTNYILSVEYGLDESFSNGYWPSMFFPDVDQYRRTVYMVSNGVDYIDGVARQPPEVKMGGQGTVTNRANK